MKNTYSEIETDMIRRFYEDNPDNRKEWLRQTFRLIAQATIDAVIPKEAILKVKADSEMEDVKYGWNFCRDQAIKNAEEFMGTRKGL